MKIFQGMGRDSNRLLICMLISWFLVNLIQAIFTEINSDEAYYYLYGKDLDWGYFDHPPLVALLNSISSRLFSGNLGARFLTVLLQPFTLLVIWKLIGARENRTDSIIQFFIISFSMVMFSAYGFITTPDVPLLFFTALFLLSYTIFLRNHDWRATLFMGICIAGLIYSKYQGFMLVFWVLLSNLKLLRNPKIWLAGILGLLLAAPHFYWQFQHNFPSFRYHLLDRSTGFQWVYLIEYLPNQLLAFNPFTLAAVFWILIKKRPVDSFERSLYFIIIGFIGGFALSAFRGHAEPHWTVAASVPMIILLTRACMRDKKVSVYTRKFIGGSLFLLLIARIILAANLLPETTGLAGKRNHVEAIKQVAGTHPVVFNGSFDDPSVYNFFTGIPSTVISNVNSRQTQFDIWRKEEEMKGKTVFVAVQAPGKSKVYKIGNYEITGFFTEDLQSTNQLELLYENLPSVVSTSDTLDIKTEIVNHSQFEFKMRHPDFPASLVAVFVGRDDFFERNIIGNEPFATLRPNEKITTMLVFSGLTLPPGDYVFGLGLNSVWGTTLNSTLQKIRVQ